MVGWLWQIQHPVCSNLKEGLSGQHTLSTTLFLLPCACLDGS